MPGCPDRIFIMRYKVAVATFSNSLIRGVLGYFRVILRNRGRSRSRSRCGFRSRDRRRHGGGNRSGNGSRLRCRFWSGFRSWSRFCPGQRNAASCQQNCDQKKRKDNSISLNYDIRKAEQEKDKAEALKDTNEYLESLGKPPVKSLDDLPSDFKGRDTLLLEAQHIALDLAQDLRS